MGTTLYLIRHGETEGSEEKRYKGTIDVPLSKRGIRQMEQIAAFISEIASPAARNDKNVKLQAVYCSDLSRAVKSAEIIAEPFRLSPVKINKLRERDFGVWEGMSFDEIKEKYPEDFNAWARNPLRFSPTGGENTLEVKERCMNAIDRVVDTHNGEIIAVVAHGGVNRIILCQFLGIPLENIFRIEQDYGAVNIIEFHGNYPVIRLINYCHPELVSL